MVRAPAAGRTGGRVKGPAGTGSARWEAAERRAASNRRWLASASRGVAQPKRSPRAPARSARNAAHICSTASEKPNSKIPPVTVGNTD